MVVLPVMDDPQTWAREVLLEQLKVPGAGVSGARGPGGNRELLARRRAPDLVLTGA